MAMVMPILVNPTNLNTCCSIHLYSLLEKHYETRLVVLHFLSELYDSEEYCSHQNERALKIIMSRAINEEP